MGAKKTWFRFYAGHYPEDMILWKKEFTDNFSAELMMAGFRQQYPQLMWVIDPNPKGGL